MMAGFQLAVIIAYGNIDFLATSSTILHSFLFGARASAKVFAIFISPFFLCGLVVFLLPWRTPLRLLTRFVPYVGFSFLALSLFISLINFYYYRFYGNPIDIFIFEGQKESLSDLYYYIKGGVSLLEFFFLLALGLVGLFYFNRQLVYLSNYRFKIKKFYWKFVYGVFVCFFFLLAARGTLHPSIVFKIARDEKVTNNTLLNNAAINGVAALYKADIQNNLKKQELHSFSNISDKQALAAFQLLYPELRSSVQNLKKNLYKKTDKISSSHNKPHVVFVLMESWGGYQMRFHNANTLNLLGELETHLKEDNYFENLLAIDGQTYAAIQFLFTNFWGFNLIDANYNQKIYTNVKVFKEQGYKTILVTSGKKSWHQLENYADFFGFDKAYGWYDIVEQYPAAPANFYGGFDHTAFDFILKKLQAKNNHTPLFVFFLTTSNHTPYFIPPDYQPYPITKIPEVMQKIISTKPKKTIKILTTYQYANNALGEFMTQIKENKNLNENTVVAAVGDHFSRRLFNYAGNEDLLYAQFLVPAYFYFPEIYQQGIFYDKERLGSQRDIFPTLFNIILSEATYLNSGNNLLAKVYKKNLAISKRFVMNRQGAIYIANKTHPTYYYWQDQILGKLRKTASPSEELLDAYQRQQAYFRLLDWHFIQAAEN